MLTRYAQFLIFFEKCTFSCTQTHPIRIIIGACYNFVYNFLWQSTGGLCLIPCHLLSISLFFVVLVSADSLQDSDLWLGYRQWQHLQSLRLFIVACLGLHVALAAMMSSCYLLSKRHWSASITRVCDDELGRCQWEWEAVFYISQFRLEGNYTKTRTKNRHLKESLPVDRVVHLVFRK